MQVFKVTYINYRAFKLDAITNFFQTNKVKPSYQIEYLAFKFFYWTSFKSNVNCKSRKRFREQLEWVAQQKLQPRIERQRVLLK